MKIFDDKEDCCGCSLCKQSCPKSAIDMNTDEEGFSYPEINAELCIDCGKCKSVCILQNKPLGNKAGERGAYAAINSDTDVLKKSSSGGVFGAAAASILENGGIVVGCVLDDEFNAVHICADNKKDVEKMHGSKYVQSSIEGVFESVASFLEEGRKVLFTGTPCQVAAMKKYNGNCEGLYTIDLVCHGVPSGSMFKKYIEHIEHEYKGKLVGYTFRGKYAGWGKTNRATFSDGHTYIIPEYKSYYVAYYFNNLISRPCCYECMFKCEERQGDLTICDYWRIGDKISVPKRKFGVSGLLVNTENGIIMMNMMKDGVELIESSFDNIAKSNRNLKTSLKVPEERSRTIKTLLQNDGDECAREFAKKNRINIVKKDIKRVLSKVVPQGIKDGIRNIIGRSR